MNADKRNIDPVLPVALRLWPGLLIVILQWLLRFVIPVFIPDAMPIGVFGALFLGLLLIVWWLFFSKAAMFDRLGVSLLMILMLVITPQFIDISIKTAMVGMMFAIYSIPVMSLAFVIWAVTSRRFSSRIQGISMYATILISAGFWFFLRTDGMDGQGHNNFVWRWAKTHEQIMLAQPDKMNVKIPVDSAMMKTEAEWPGFRGPNRDGIVKGVKINTDWTKSTPVLMWRKAVGPGCSSFAVHGNLFFTQEQRGEYEMVTCYDLKSGELIWKHGDSTRFWDAHAGAGPRSTPTIDKGRIYSLGATGILNVLNEFDGTVLWSRNAASDTKVQIPGWGYASSPLVVDSLVIVAIAGQIMAYDKNKGELRWSGNDGGESYSSPHLLTIKGVKQVIFLNKKCATAFLPSSGKILWKYETTGAPIVQPAKISESDILISDADGNEIRRISIKNESGEWKTENRWNSNKLRPYFNDFVVHRGYAYGFDGPSLSCIDIEKGIRQWKGGRYGGQLILIADQDLLLIVSEKGEIVLVKASPQKLTEITKSLAIKGKTWNHPVLTGNILLVRNMDEMAAFRLPLELLADK